MPVMRSTYIATLFIAFIAMPAVAQAPAEGARQRVVGTVDKLDGNNLMVKANDGQPVTVVLDDMRQCLGWRSAPSWTSSPAITSPRVGSKAPTARSTRSKCASFRRRCAAPAKANARGSQAGRGHDQ